MEPLPSVSPDETVARSVGDGGSRDPLDQLTEFDVRALTEPVGVFRGTEADGLLRVNQHFLDITGLQSSAARGWDWLIAVHSEDRDRLRRAIAAACQTGAKSAFPIRMQVAVGVVETLRITMGATPGPADAFVFVGAVESETNPAMPAPAPAVAAVDVDASDPFEVLVASMPVALAYAAPDGTIEYANDPWRRLTGVDADGSIADALDVDLEALTGEGSAGVVIARDDRSMQVSVATIAARLGGGRVVTVSELVDAAPAPSEVEIGPPAPAAAAPEPEIEAPGRDGEDALPAIVRAAPAAIFGVDLDGRIELWNPGAEALFGWPAEEVIGDVAPFLSEEQQRQIAEAAATLTAGHEIEAQATFQRRDGSRVVVALSAAPIMNAEGTVASVVTVAVDVTEQVDAAAELERRSQIEQFNATLSRSLLDASPSSLAARVVDVLGELAHNYDAISAGVFVRGTDAPDFVWPPGGDGPQLVADALPEADAFLLPEESSSGTAVGGWVVAGARGPIGVVALELRDPEGFVIEELTHLGPVGTTMVAAIERVHAEEELRANELRFRRLAEHANDWVVVVGAELERRYLSPAAARFLGLAEDAEFDPEQPLVHEDDRDATFARMTEIACEPLGSQTEPFVARFRRADGEYRWVELQVINLLGDSIIDGLVINGHDVTEDYLAEQRLRESEGRFRSLVQNLAEGVIVLASDGTVKYASESAARMMGFDEGHGRGLMGLEFVIEEDRDRVAEVVAAAFSEPGIHGPVKLRVETADGEIRVVEAMGHNRLDDPNIEGDRGHLPGHHRERGG